MSSDSGRNNIISPTWWANLAPAPAMPTIALASQGLWPPETFLGKRARFDATFYNDVSWRPFVMRGIFESSNLVVPLSRRIARQMIARAQNAFFGSDPWLGIESLPEPSQEIDEELASQIERFVRFKSIETCSKEDKKRIISRALVLGECPVKTSYVVRDQIFAVEAQVLTDVEENIVSGADGNAITSDDDVEDDEQGRTVLSRDKQTEISDAPIWTKKTLSRRQIMFQGARSEPIFYKDFLCPLNATDVQSAECVCHLYDKPVAEFVDLIVKRGMIADDPGQRQAAAARMSAIVKQIGSNSSEPKAALTQELRPNENFSPQPQSADSGPVAEFIEFYLWFDANEDGIAENVMLIADRQTRQPIFYDHVANVTTDGLRPIEIVRINPVEGRGLATASVQNGDLVRYVDVESASASWGVALRGETGLKVYGPEMALRSVSDDAVVASVPRARLPQELASAVQPFEANAKLSGDKMSKIMEYLSKAYGPASSEMMGKYRKLAGEA
jgi:hypothetical protein